MEDTPLVLTMCDMAGPSTVQVKHVGCCLAIQPVHVPVGNFVQPRGGV